MIRPGDVVLVSRRSASGMAGFLGIVTEVGPILTARVYFSDSVADRVLPVALLEVVSREAAIN